MTKVIIDIHHGGIAQDTRDFTTTEAATSGGFVVSKTSLTPARESVRESGATGNDPTGLKLSGFILDETTGYILANGQSTTGSTLSTLYYKDSTSDITKSFQKGGVSATSIYRADGLFMYQGKPHAIGQNGTSLFVEKWTAYGSAPTSLGTATASYTPQDVPTPFVHPEDDVAYIGFGNVLYKLNGSAFTTALTLPTSYEITSINAYGGYLAIGVRTRTSYGRSRAFLWGRDTTLTTLQESIDFGEGELKILTLINNVLYGISYIGYNPLSTNFTRKIIVRAYSGGSASKIKEIAIPNNQDITNQRVEKDGKCYFTSSQNSDSLWVLGANINDKITLDRDRFIYNGNEVNTIYSFGLVGDYLFATINDGFASDQLWYTKNADTYSGTAYREFLINHGMTHEDRFTNKQLNSVKLYWEAQEGDAVASVPSLEYSVDGSAYTEILTDSQTSGNYVKNATRQTDGSQLKSGREIQLKVKSQGGAIVHAIEYNYTNLEQK